MSNQLARSVNQSAKEPVPGAGALLESEPVQQRELPSPAYKPYTEEPTVPDYRPYSEKPALSETPYEPYKGI